MFTPHSEKQDKAIFSIFPITLCATGIQWGKTITGANWLFEQYFEYPTDNFIVTAPTYKLITQATLPAFLEVFGDFGVYKKGDSIFELDTGGIVYFRTGTDPDSIVGITNVRAVWCDEAGLYSLYFWENIQARIARLKGRAMLTTSPYALNWIFKDIIKPFQQKKRQDVLLISASSIENPTFSKERYDQQKLTMDPRRFNALYNGQFERMQGLVYDCYDDYENKIMEYRWGPGVKIYAGVDWGFTDPFVCLIHAIMPTGLRIQISEFYKTGLKPSEIVDFLKKKHQIYNFEMIYCDPSKPDMILEIQQSGVPTVKAENDIYVGVGVVYEELKTRRFKILDKSSPYTVDEIETYHYPNPKDLKEDQSAKDEKPVDKDNHAMDAMRYVIMGTRDMTHKYKPTVPQEVLVVNPQEMPHESIERLQRQMGRDRTERWS